MSETISPIKKIEPEFIPHENTFGLVDLTERQELISLMSSSGIKHVNFCYPLKKDLARAPRLVRWTLEMAQDFHDQGFDVSMCGVNKAKRLRKIERIGGRPLLEIFTHFNNVQNDPEVAAWCAIHEIKYVPTVANPAEIEQREQQGYPMVKALPWIDLETGKGLHREVAQYDGNLLFDAAGGIRPIIIDRSGNPVEVSQHFLDAAAMGHVSLISVTQPTKVFLTKGIGDDPLGKAEKYFDLIRQAA